VVPKSIEANLPFASKPKLLGKRSRPTYETKRAVLLEPEERKMHHLMQQLNTMKNTKVAKATAKRKETHRKHLKEIKLKVAKQAEHAKEHRKKIFREISIAEKKQAKRQKTAADFS